MIVCVCSIEFRWVGDCAEFGVGVFYCVGGVIWLCSWGAFWDCASEFDA